MNELRMLSGAAITVPGTGDTEIAKIQNTRGHTRLCFHLDVATQALDNLDIDVLAHDDATEVDMTPANYQSLAAAEYRMLFASGITGAGTMSANTNGYFEMDITGLKTVSVKASAGADSAAVTPRWSLH